MSRISSRVFKQYIEKMLQVSNQLVVYELNKIKVVELFHCNRLFLLAGVIQNSDIGLVIFF